MGWISSTDPREVKGTPPSLQIGSRIAWEECLNVLAVLTPLTSDDEKKEVSARSKVQVEEYTL
jgi:hypothetical protein